MKDSDIDKHHIWHPYSSMDSSLPIYEVQSAQGVRLKLKDGRELIDGMASWWCKIHGYNHPVINASIESQLNDMSHVMFGGLTHQPAIKLTELLVKLTPDRLDKVFYSDSGSVAVEVAMKMAIQYWQANNRPSKQKFVALRSAYHGDTFAAMSVSDPQAGMHRLFSQSVAKQFFVKQPTSRFSEKFNPEDIVELENVFIEHADEIAAFIVEPIVQGAGGMWFYSAEYLTHAKNLCKKYQVLLIADEIATGFGRTGKLFACEHANLVPDIMCIGKALTGGYLTLAATVTSSKISKKIDEGEPGVFMHGPTFMANPLACSAAIASIHLLIDSNWQNKIKKIESQLKSGLEICKTYDNVQDVRVLGAIGVVEMKQAVDMRKITELFIGAGVWIRPFGKLIYLMPPFIINDDDLKILTRAVVETIKLLSSNNNLSCEH